jgi:quaternary ammonium compound-resistance protein SugE
LDLPLVHGDCELGSPLGLELGLTSAVARPTWIGSAVVAMVTGGALRLRAQRSIPIRNRLGSLDGIAAVGIFVVGVLLFGDGALHPRLVSIGLVIAGIVGLRPA